MRSCRDEKRAPGPAGPQGEQGQPGEVSNQQLNDTVNSTIAGTANNLASVGPYTGTFSDPPTFTPNADSRTLSEFGASRDARLPRLGQQFLRRDGTAIRWSGRSAHAIL